jgi:hypothetical protein
MRDNLRSLKTFCRDTARETDHDTLPELISYIFNHGYIFELLGAENLIVFKNYSTAEGGSFSWSLPNGRAKEIFWMSL